MFIQRFFQFPFNFLVMLIALGFVIFIFTDSRPSTLDMPRDSGTIRIGYAVEYPYAFVDENQQVRGESPDTAREIAKRLGFTQIEWIEMPFVQLIPNLQARHIDMIASGMFITPERQKMVRFSHPTLQFYSGLLIPASNPKLLQPKDIENQRRDVKIAVIAQSIEQMRLLQFDGEKIIVVGNLIEGLDALDTLKADGVLLPIPSLRDIALSFPDDYMLLSLNRSQTPSFTMHNVAFAFHPNDVALVNAWNEQLQMWVGTASQQQLIALYGFKPMEMPSIPFN